MTLSIELRFMQLPGYIQDPLLELAFRIAPVGRLPHVNMLMDFFTSLGGDRHEIRRTLEGMHGFANWGPRWKSTAAATREQAEDALAAGHEISARDTFLRASMYYILSDHMNYDTEKKREAFKDVRYCHDRFRELSDGEIEKVEIASPDGTVYGFFRTPPDVERPPCVVIVQGSDTVKELLARWEDIFLARGMATLNIDQPGNGETRLDGLVLDDTSKGDHCVKAVVDYLESRAEIDSTRIGIYGFSWGGFVAPYFTAREPRIKACAILSAVYSVPWGGGDPSRFVKPYRLRFMYASGSRDMKELSVLLPKVTLEGVADKITSPILIIHGEKDGIIPVEMAHRLAGEVSGPKELIIVDGDDHGCTKHLETFVLPKFGDWMADSLRNG